MKIDFIEIINGKCIIPNINNKFSDYCVAFTLSFFSLIWLAVSVMVFFLPLLIDNAELRFTDHLFAILSLAISGYMFANSIGLFKRH